MANGTVSLPSATLRLRILQNVNSCSVRETAPLPQWARLLVNFPVDGKSRVASLRSSDEKGDLTPLLKAQVSWIIARNDRAWYALGQAKERLHKLGLSDDDIYKLDGDWKGYSAADRGWSMLRAT